MLRGGYTLAKGRGPELAMLAVHNLSAPWLGPPGHGGFRGCLGCLSPTAGWGIFPEEVSSIDVSGPWWVALSVVSSP